MANDGTVLPCEEDAPLDGSVKEDGTPGKTLLSLGTCDDELPLSGSEENSSTKITSLPSGIELPTCTNDVDDAADGI